MPFSIYISPDKHCPFACQKPICRHAAIPNERNEPTDFKEASPQIFALSIEMTLIYFIIGAEHGYILYQLIIQ